MSIHGMKSALLFKMNGVELNRKSNLRAGGTQKCPNHPLQVDIHKPRGQIFEHMYLSNFVDSFSNLGVENYDPKNLKIASQKILLKISEILKV